MKRLILLSYCAVGVLVGGLSQGLSRGQEESQEQPRAAVVNIQELFRKYYKSDRTQEEINLERARIQKDHNDTMGRLRSMDEALRQLAARLQQTDLSPEDRAAVEREQGLRLQERQVLDQNRRDVVLARHAELNKKMVVRMENLLEEIRLLVADWADQAGYDLVFDVDGLNTSQVPVLLFAKNATDITPMILKELNKNAPPQD